MIQTIELSGGCRIQKGHIIASKITAKTGIDAKNIGTASSTASKLRVGVEEHINYRIRKIDEELSNSLSLIKSLETEILKLEETQEILYQQVTEKAQVQDRTQLDIKRVENRIKRIQRTKRIYKISK